MDNTKKGVAEWFAEKGTYIYLLAMLLLFALYHTNKMFRLVDDKWKLFQFFTFFYFCAMLPAVGKGVYGFIKKRPAFKRQGLDLVFAAALFLAVVLSTVLSGEGGRIFWRMPTDRSISGLCFIGCILVYLAVRYYGVYDGFVLWAWMIGSAVIYLYGILCSCGINFLHIQDGVAEKYYFLSPLGGSNINATYVCLMLPVIMVMYMICKERFSQAIFSIYLFMGFLFSIFIKTESSAIAMVFGLLLLGYFALEKRGWFGRYAHVVALYLGAKGTVCILLFLFPDKLYPFDGINLLLLEPKIILGEVAAWILVNVAQRRMNDRLRKAALDIRKYLLGVAVAAALCFVAAVLVANIRGDAVSEGSFLSHFLITDEMFNSRGFIWRRTAKILGEEPLMRKLFGNGLGSLFELIYSGPDREALLARMGGAGFYDPHDEYLQALVDIGLLGFVGYFGLIVTTLAKSLRRWKENELQIVVALVVSVYLVQAVVNAYSIMHLPLWFIFLGLANGAMAAPQEEIASDCSNGANG